LTHRPAKFGLLSALVHTYAFSLERDFSLSGDFVLRQVSSSSVGKTFGKFAFSFCFFSVFLFLLLGFPRSAPRLITGGPAVPSAPCFFT